MMRAEALVGHRAGGEAVQVRARDENLAFRGRENHALDAPFERRLRDIEMRVEFLERGVVEDVHRRIGPVERQHADAVGAGPRGGCWMEET